MSTPFSTLSPPAELQSATLASFIASTSSQRKAKAAIASFVESAAERQNGLSGVRRFFRWMVPGRSKSAQGKYLVGPVGTGKSHLLAACYNALNPDVPCAYLHSGAIFRSTTHPRDMAQSIASQFDVLCLDELEIDDAAYEARMATFLKAVDAAGTTIVASSNVIPAQFMSTRLGTGRLENFLMSHFSERFQMIPVRGPDRRRQGDAPGTGWIGPPEEASNRLREHCGTLDKERLLISCRDLLKKTEERPHKELLDALTRYDALCVQNIQLTSTDAALRLLRLVDALHANPNAPTFHFSASAKPEAWFAPDETTGAEREVAAKFARTASRVYAMCTMHEVKDVPADDSKSRLGAS